MTVDTERRCPGCGAIDPMGDEDAWHRADCPVVNASVARPLRHVVNDHGVVFHVRVVLKGERWGAEDRFTHESHDPLVEFYDTRFPEKFGELGQFVARYALSTLAGAVVADPRGLQLYGDTVSWTATYANVAEAIAFAEWRLAGGSC